ncbi:437_t:CDS:2 [Funneliformis geosporum]|nr:437_t:CDS:2 [Funneliformis geosporum]
MDETTCERFPKTVEYSTNQCQDSQWKENKGSNSPGEVSVMWPLPADSCKHELGRTLPTVEFLYKASNKESDAREAKGISHTEAGRFKEKYHEGGNKKEIPPTYNKHYIYDTRQQNKEIHGRGFCFLNTSKTARINEFKAKRNETDDSRVEVSKYDDISKGEICPNREGVSCILAPTWQLLRVGAVGNVEGRTKWTSCRFVQPYYRIGRDGSQRPLHTVSEGGTVGRCNNSPMVIEIIANESDRHQLALSLNRGFCDVSRLTECMNAKSGYDIYFDEVQEFGFSHIILVGKRNYGIIFIDCYGRFFELDRMSDALWPLGNSLEEVATKRSDGTVWDVDDNGIVHEFEYYIESELTTHIINTGRLDNLKPQKLDDDPPKISMTSGGAFGDV